MAENIGIYQLRNTKNEKLYIGSSCNLKKRKSSHFLLLRKNKHHSKKLQNAYNKYGADSFIFEVLEICSKENILLIEQQYLDKYDVYKKGYNMSNIANRPSHTNSRESIKKGIETRRKNGNFKFTEEHKENISIALKNSESFQKKIREIANNRKKEVYQYNSQGELIDVFSCAEEASLKTGIYKRLIVKNLNKIQVHTHNFLFSYFSDFKTASFKKERPTPKVKYINMYDLNGNFIKQYNSAKEYGLEYNYNSDQISRYIKKQSTFKGHLISYGEQH